MTHALVLLEGEELQACNAIILITQTDKAQKGMDSDPKPTEQQQQQPIQRCTNSGDKPSRRQDSQHTTEEQASQSLEKHCATR